MKIQSRPPEAVKPAMDADTIAEYLEFVISAEAQGQNRMYRSVVLKGALQMLVQQEIIRQYSLENDSHGYHGFRLTLEFPDFALQHRYL